MQELYDHNPVRPDIPQLDHHHDARQYPSWANVPRAAHNIQATLPPHPQQRHDAAMMRRNTFPYVRHDREEIYMGPEHDPSFPHRTDSLYSEPLSIDGSHLSLGPDSHIPRPDQFHLSSSPATSFRDFEHSEGAGIKLEDHTPVILPSQSYMHPQQNPPLPLVAGYPVPHGIPIQHTDDAASKETQYLRRRCYNCHTTEPPSWRRSTLTPGKIVCNKCGLYERTHLRPRPLRFDELRAGNKSRKQSKVASPKGPKILPPGSMSIKKEEIEPISRRLSVSSTSSTNGGTSDWDDSVSLYSSGSAPQSGFNSPAVAPYPIPRDPSSQSPPMESTGIRLPNAPLNDIATLSTPPSRRESPYFQSTGLPVTGSPQQTLRRPDIPEVTGWQSVPMTDLGPADKLMRKNSIPTVRKAVAA
jgi:GATA-binding protein